MAEVREGLLKKQNKVDYYENCPGCKIDHLKETTPGPPLGGSPAIFDLF